MSGGVITDTEATWMVQRTGTHTYAIGEFVVVESDFEVFLFDESPGDRVADPDIVIRKTVGGDLAADWTDGHVRVRVPASLPTEKTSSTEPIEFTKAIMTAVDHALQRRGATLAFGGVLRSPGGAGVGLFGNSGCGKTTAAFRLATQRRYQVLAGDLLICRGREIGPFPRYMNLPRDVPAVEQWYRSAASSADRIRQWDDELDVPRALISETVPERVELDYVVLVDPVDPAAGRGASPELDEVSTERAIADLTAWNRTNLEGWTSHPAVHHPSEDPGTARRTAIREMVADAECYRITSSREALARSVTGLVGP